MKAFVYLTSGLVSFCAGYYFVVTGESIPVLGPFSGFFPTMLGVYLLYRWDKEHSHLEHHLKHDKNDQNDHFHL